MQRLTVALAALVASVAFAAPPPAAPPADAAAAPALTGDELKKTLYALGMSLGKNVGDFALTKEELAEVQKGFSDEVLKATPKVKMEDYMPKLQTLFQQRKQVRGQAELKKGAEYLEKAAKEKGAQKLPSGVIYTELKAGTGASPDASDSVSVHYKGTLIDGTEFDSSYKRNAPADFPLNGVIPCWTEGVAKMKPSGKARLVCPADKAYGPNGRPGIPPNAVLVFEVELLSVKPKPAATPAMPK